MTWITPEFGLIKTVAKGALRPRNRLAGILDLFHRCEIQFQSAKSSPLHSLRDALLLETFEGLRGDFTRLALASYAVELLEKSAEPETPVPELFDLLNRALRYLHQNPASLKALLHFESELARLLGIASPGHPSHISLERVLQRLPISRTELVNRLSS